MRGQQLPSRQSSLTQRSQTARQDFNITALPHTVSSCLLQSSCAAYSLPVHAVRACLNGTCVLATTSARRHCQCHRQHEAITQHASAHTSMTRFSQAAWFQVPKSVTRSRRSNTRRAPRAIAPSHSTPSMSHVARRGSTVCTVSSSALLRAHGPRMRLSL